METRKNPTRNGKRANTSNTLRPGHARRGLLRGSHPISGELPVANRRPLPNKRRQTLGNALRAHRGILPIRQDQGIGHSIRHGAQKTLPNRKPRSRKLRRPWLHATTRDHRKPERDTMGILIGWREVRIADSCVQTLLQIQTMANSAQKLLGGKWDAVKHALIKGAKRTWKCATEQDMADYSSARRSTHA